MQHDVEGVAPRASVPQHSIQHVLGHLPPRRPLPPRDERRSRAGIRRYHVIPADLPPRGGVGIARERPPSPPRAEHVAPTDLQILRQILLALLEHPLYLLLGGVRQRLGRSLLVGRADDDASLPGEEEEESTVARVVIEQSHVLGGVVPGQDDVRPRRPHHRRVHGSGRPVLLLPQRVRERPPGEYHVPRSYVEPVPRRPIDGSHPRYPSVVVEYRVGHLDVIRDVRPVPRRAKGDGDVRPGVVVLTLVEDRAVLDVLLVQLRELDAAARGSHDVTRGTRETAETVVEFEHRRREYREEREEPMSEGGGPYVPLGERTDYRYPIREVRLLLEHVPTFLVAVEHHHELAVEVVHGPYRARKEIP